MAHWWVGNSQFYLTLAAYTVFATLHTFYFISPGFVLPRNHLYTPNECLNSTIRDSGTTYDIFTVPTTKPQSAMKTLHPPPPLRPQALTPAAAAGCLKQDEYGSVHTPELPAVWLGLR